MMSRAVVSCGRFMALQARFGVVNGMARSVAPREIRPSMIAFYSTKTKGDQELSSFLSDEIIAERKARKHDAMPKVEGFDMKTKGSEVTLVRKFNDEMITVALNVNHTVDAEDVSSTQSGEATESGEMLSKPNFDVTIEKAGQKLVLSCAYASDPSADQDGYDLFQIVEFSMHTGEELQDSDYSVSGDIMDGHLYDLLMNLLEERGVTNEFAEQLIDLSTSYEHGLYINLLEKLRDFVSK
ncbi:complement component 1 Q subcomponent-binding protein, mitochondrial-like isoform X2 [Varroa jacobsoni]|uniref:Complement component 1 Q subcomponent-binding protein, mitochondrial n=1 Tax=Varroa destructor TaxID=109461 RepID=A0A7M7KJK6_VARDE|nr:complement component 1 Q subcomponent-binding protein, mitochondrial-like isoform X2 [Varroa destructor]XP_022692485.1 complement component 1 Q subcomponent-binding protein, mitochondrial-like isoform X2 [Varroa jacobsoni]